MRSRAALTLYLLIVPSLAWAQVTPKADADKPKAEKAEAAGKVAHGSDVKLHDTVVFSVLRDHEQQTAQARARKASQALDHAADSEHAPVRVVKQGDARVLFAADAPVIELFADDAVAAGDASLDVHAARLSARVRDALRAEKQRSVVAQTVFSLSLVVFFGMIALFAARRLGELALRARTFVLEHPERVPAIRLQSIELIGKGPLRAALLAALVVGRWLLLVGVVYVWLVFTLSRFEATQPYTGRLASFVVTPLSELTGRLLSALPMSLLALVSGVAVYLLVRFVELFFASVERGETHLPWLPRDLVLPTGLLLRVAIVLLALVFAGPVVTGDPQGALARAGSIVMMALAVATAPLLASVAIGVVQVFSRRIRVGQELTLGQRTGRVLSVGLLDVRMLAADGCEVRVPHLLSLVQAQHTRRGDAPLQVAVSVSADAHPAAAKELLLTAAARFGQRPQVELADFDADGLHFRVSVDAQGDRSAADLRVALAQALTEAAVALGRASRGGSHS